MKKFYVAAAFAIVLQIFFFIGRSFQYPVEEDFRQLVKKYERVRYTEARKQVEADKSQISERDFERIMYLMRVFGIFTYCRYLQES